MPKKTRAISATLWSGADILLRQGIQFCISIVLARLLTPEEFGTVALLSIFTGIATAFVDSGFSSALIQRKNTSSTDESTVFWFNLAIGGLVSLGLWEIAPLIADFFVLPILTPLTELMAINIFLSALGSIHGTLFTKKLNFRVQMKIGVFSNIISGSVAIIMAYYDYGIWALATQTLIATSLTTILLWSISPWRPKIVFSKKSVSYLFSFGGYMMASSLLEIIYNRAYTLLVGHFFGVRVLGFYNRADGTRQLPVGMLTSLLSRVALPIFSSANQDKAQLRRAAQLAIRGMMLINIPMMLGLAVTAEPLILTLFGVKWLPTVPYLQILSIAAIVWPLHLINLNILMAQGHSNLLFRIDIIKKIICSILLIAGVFYGVLGIAWSQVIGGLISFIINTYYTKHFLDYGMLDQTCDFLATLIISIIMAVTVYLISNQTYLWPFTILPIVKLLILIVLGLNIFLLLAKIFHLEALSDIIFLFKKRKNEHSTS